MCKIKKTLLTPEQTMELSKILKRQSNLQEIYELQNLRTQNLKTQSYYNADTCKFTKFPQHYSVIIY